MAAKRTSKGTFKPGTSGNPEGRGKRTYNSDGWGSAITGIGDAMYDKRTSHTFCPSPLSYEQCIEIFEGDDLGRKAAAATGDDAFRPGYEITISDEGEFEDLKEDVENRLRELKVDKVLRKAIAQKRALGGSAILIGVQDHKSMDRPLDLKKITDIDFLSNLEPMDLSPYTYYDNHAEPKFGEVKLWELRSFGSRKRIKVATSNEQGKGIYIHESRLIIFNQDQISKYTSSHNPAGDYWGLSIYVQIYEILRDFNISWASAGLVVTDFSQAVFSIDNLMQLVMRDEEGLRKRMLAMNMGRSVARAVIVDTKEKFERQTTNVSGLAELLVQLSRRFAASIDTPLSVLMGGGTKTDDAEMGEELRYYYDRLESMQRDDLGPVIRMFAEIIMRGMRQRKLPKKWGVQWHPLWRLTKEQEANARLAQARVDAIYVKHGVLDPDTVAKLRFGGEYSFDTSLPNNYKAPGFQVLPPMGVLVEGSDPKTGLPPGEVPPAASTGAGETGAHGVSQYARRNPRQTSLAGSDPTAGGDTPGRADEGDDPEVLPEDVDGDYPEDSD